MKALKISFVLLVLLALAVTLTGCCCPFDFSSLLGETEFTAGNFPDVPVYPGATQSTESDTVLSAMTAVFSLITSEEEWKHYVTSDSDISVLDWYQDRLPGQNWVEASSEELGTTDTEGTLMFTKSNDSNLFLVIFAISGIDTSSSDTDIVIGRLRVTGTD